MAKAGLDVVDFVDIGVECTLRQLLEHGFFHADPHPGNLLATKDGDECYLTYLDFGMCVCVVVCLHVFVCVFLYVCVCVCFCMFACVCVYVCVYYCMYMCVYLSVW